MILELYKSWKKVYTKYIASGIQWNIYICIYKNMSNFYTRKKKKIQQLRTKETQLPLEVTKTRQKKEPFVAPHHWLNIINMTYIHLWPAKSTTQRAFTILQPILNYYGTPFGTKSIGKWRIQSIFCRFNMDQKSTYLRSLNKSV